MFNDYFLCLWACIPRKKKKIKSANIINISKQKALDQKLELQKNG